MKKTILLFAIIFSLFSCSKDDEPTPTPPENYRLTKITYSNGGYTTYTYNSQGKLSIEEWFNQNQISTDKITHTYNSQGKETGTLISYNSGSFTQNIQKTYNSSGYLDEEINNIVQNGVSSTQKTTYITNASGFLIEKKIVNKDAMGNWLALNPSNHWYYTNDAQGRAIKVERASLSDYNEMTYDTNDNMTLEKQYQKSGANFYLNSLITQTFDSKINPSYQSFGTMGKNNRIDVVRKDYHPDGSLFNTYSDTNVIEYNEQNLPTKINGNIYTYEKY